jgi:hypothetical protein
MELLRRSSLMNSPSDLETIHTSSLSHMTGGLAAEPGADGIQKGWQRAKVSGIGCLAAGALGAGIGFYKSGVDGMRKGFGAGCVLGTAVATALSSASNQPRLLRTNVGAARSARA